jgi:GrpB protein
MGGQRQHARRKKNGCECTRADIALWKNSTLGRIEHYGSTAVPGLAAKPIVDMLIEVTDLDATRARIAPILDGEGYDYFWRPTFGDNVPPWYAWFIKRDQRGGARTHHLHMITRGLEFADHWRAQGPACRRTRARPHHLYPRQVGIHRKSHGETDCVTPPRAALAYSRSFVHIVSQLLPWDYFRVARHTAGMQTY